MIRLGYWLDSHECNREICLCNLLYFPELIPIKLFSLMWTDLSPFIILDWHLYFYIGRHTTE